MPFSAASKTKPFIDLSRKNAFPWNKEKALVLGAKGRSILSVRARSAEVFEPLRNAEITHFSEVSKTKPFTSRHLSILVSSNSKQAAFKPDPACNETNKKDNHVPTDSSRTERIGKIS